MNKMWTENAGIGRNEIRSQVSALLRHEPELCETVLGLLDRTYRLGGLRVIEILRGDILRSLEDKFRNMEEEIR